MSNADTKALVKRAVGMTASGLGFSIFRDLYGDTLFGDLEESLDRLQDIEDHCPPWSFAFWHEGHTITINESNDTFDPKFHGYRYAWYCKLWELLNEHKLRLCIIREEGGVQISMSFGERSHDQMLKKDEKNDQ